MSEETKTILVKRLKSLAWRVGIFAAVLLVNYISDNLGLFKLATWEVTLISLGLAEVTKHLNTLKQQYSISS